MKQRRHFSSHRLSRDAERLVWLAKGMADSGSRVEDAWWEGELNVLVGKLLAGNHEEALNQALDRLHETHGRAYDELADLIEAGAESVAVEGKEGVRRALLLALPVQAWSRYSIPSRSLPASVLGPLRVQLAAHVLAEDVRLALADFLFSPDQLPHGYVETRRFLERLAKQAQSGKDLRVDAKALPEAGQYISDLRYVLAAVLVPPGQPVFRWNEVDGDRDSAATQWRNQAGPAFQAAMPGCIIEPLLPDAYFSAWRRADRESRGFSLVASVAYLNASLGEPPARLRAVLAPYHDHRLVEWRVGFAGPDDDAVLHGVVWPLLGAEDEGADVGTEIERILKSAGLVQVSVIDQRMPLEYCDDCGAPLYPNADGESVHAEMPEPETDSPPLHLH